MMAAPYQDSAAGFVGGVHDVTATTKRRRCGWRRERRCGWRCARYGSRRRATMLNRGLLERGVLERGVLKRGVLKRGEPGALASAMRLRAACTVRLPAACTMRLWVASWRVRCRWACGFCTHRT